MAIDSRMDRAAASNLFKNRFRKLNWQTVVVLAAIFALLPTLLTHLTLWRLERKLQIQIKRKPVFFLVPGRVVLKNASLEWKDQIRVDSGFLSLKFPITASLFREYSFSIDGNQLVVHLESALQSIINKDNILFRRVNGEFAVRKNGKLDVLSLDADSDVIQFHMNKKDAFHKKLIHSDENA